MAYGGFAVRAYSVVSVSRRGLVFDPSHFSVPLVSLGLSSFSQDIDRRCSSYAITSLVRVCLVARTDSNGVDVRPEDGVAKGTFR